ncbi:MAG: hypothetical protein LWW94_08805 [Candidatus Desulfofervidaceae bacterium]|nr:hypothetical protein [Candidatus Desulfofervidaceae bacterium]
MRELTIKIPVNLLEMDFVKKFVERVKLELAVNELDLDENELMCFAEEIKKSWWERNGKKFLEGIINENSC